MTEMDNVFDKMRDLPLLQGISETTLHSLLEKYPFHFLKYGDGEKIFSCDDPCTHIRFIFSGAVRFVVKSLVSKISISYSLEAPNAMGAEFLFGRKPNYPFDAYAQGECGILQLTKADYIKIIQSDDVFLFNILNYLSRNAQETTLRLLSLSHGNIPKRLSLILESLVPPHASQVELEFKQKDLCLMLGSRRSSLLTSLEDMKKKHKLDYTQSSITIEDRDFFIDMANL